MRDGDPMAALAVLVATIACMAIAVLVFEHGLHRYAAGNGVLELR